MSLAERIAEAERRRNECAVDTCHEPRVVGALFCKANGHLWDQWQGRLVRLDDGTFIRREHLRARGAA